LGSRSVVYMTLSAFCSPVGAGCRSFWLSVFHEAKSMIEVEGLTKRYGERTAISGLTFKANKGEVVGFLGPNGAGKTTTMRILTGYMPPSEGKGKVAGYDLLTESL